MGTQTTLNGFKSFKPPLQQTLTPTVPTPKLTLHNQKSIP